MKRPVLLLLVLATFGTLGCQPEGPVPIGIVLPLSGDAAVYGKSILNGIELAYEQSQADETMPRMAILTSDTKGDGDAARDAMIEMGENGVLAVIGGVTSAEAMAMIPAAEEIDRTLLSPSASSPEFSGISRNFFRIFPSDFLEGTKMGSSAKSLGIDTVVILAKAEPHAAAIQQVFKAEFERNDGEVLETIEIPSGAMDLTGIIDRVVELDPEAVYVTAFATDIATMIGLLRDQNFTGKILTTHAFAAPEVIAASGEKALGVFVTKPAFDVTDDNPAVVQFVNEYSTKFGVAPDLYSAHGYDAFNIVAQGLNNGGSFPSDFVKALRAMQDFPGVAGTVQFDEKGDVQKFPRVYQVDEGGQLVNYEEKIRKRKEELMAKKEALQKKMAETRRRMGGG